MVYIISIITFDIVYYFTHTHTINNIHLHLLISTFPTEREREIDGALPPYMFQISDQITPHLALLTIKHC